MTPACAVKLLKEGHLVDLAQRRDARRELSQARIAQERHAFFPRRALDFRSRPAVDDHFANAVGKVEQLGDRGASAIAAAGAFQAPGAFVEREPASIPPGRGRIPSALRGA